MAHICHMPAHKNIETFNNVALQYIKKTFDHPYLERIERNFGIQRLWGEGGLESTHY